MNEQNYCSLSASKKLVEADIILKTDVFWIKVSNNPWMLSEYTHGAYGWYPAPSFAELWRELPEDTRMTKCRKEGSAEVYAEIFVESWDDYGYQPSLQENINPADAAAELLIWVRREKP